VYRSFGVREPGKKSSAMGKAILAVNAGTSSVSISVFKRDQPPSKIASAKLSGLTAPPVVFKYSCGSNQKSQEVGEDIQSPQDAFKYLIEHFLNDSSLKVVDDKSDFAYVCHRVVHGGELQNAVLINEETKHYLQKLKDLAPL
jgi:acetate kinase